MAIAIRGTTPSVTITTSDPVSVTLTGSQQPQADDVLVIIYFNDYYILSNMPTPSVGGSTTGVNAVTGGTADAGTDSAHIKAFTYVVGSSGDLTVSADEAGAGDEDKGFAIYVLSGVDTANPIDVAGTATLTGGSTHICPSVSPTSSDAYLICHTNSGGGAATASYTHPSGMTETYDSSVGGVSACGAILQLSASGATGSKTFTPATGLANNAEISIAVKTAGGAAADTSAYVPTAIPGRIGPNGKVFAPTVRYDDTTTPAATGTVAETQDNQTSTATGVLGYTGTVAETQDNQTSNASGQLGYSGTVTETQDAQTSTAAGTLGYSGTVAETQDNQTSSATGSVGGAGEVSGTLAETQDPQTASAAGQLGYSGTTARTQANQTAAAAGWITITGTVAETQDAQTSTASGKLGYSGTVAAIQANQTGSASGWIPVTGLVTETQDNQTPDANGFVGEIPYTPETLTLKAVGVGNPLTAVNVPLTLEALED